MACICLGIRSGTANDLRIPGESGPLFFSSRFIWGLVVCVLNGTGSLLVNLESTKCIIQFRDSRRTRIGICCESSFFPVYMHRSHS